MRLSKYFTRGARRLMVVAAMSVAVLFVTAFPAAAHVTVWSPDAAPKDFGKLVFRVPTESEGASTVRVSITLPTDTPFAFVSTKPHPGWTVKTTEQKLDEPINVEGFKLTKAVSKVTWNAQPGRGIDPGQFDEFELSVGPFPAEDELLFPAVQEYSDGEVVKWNQPTSEEGKEPEHPAPTLSLKANTAMSGATHATTATAKANGSDGLARGLGAAGLGLGAIALAVFGRRHIRL